MLRDTEVLALHARLLDRYGRELEGNERWQELQEWMKGDQVVDLLDPQVWDKHAGFIEETQDFLGLVREAAAAGGPIYPLDFSKGMEMEAPHLKKVRDMVRLLHVDAMYQAAHGRMDTYVADITAMFQFSDALSAEPLLISHLMRMAVMNIAFDAVASGPNARELGTEHVARLQERTASASAREAFADSFAGEAQMALAMFDSIREGADSIEWIAVPAVLPDKVPLAERLVLALYESPLGGALVSADELEFVQGVDALVSANRLPLYQAREYIQAAQEQCDRLPRRRVFTRLLLPSLVRGSQAQARAEAMMDLTRLGLEMEQYHAETGQLPQSLNEVAARLGESVPIDPYTGESYIYRPAGDSFQLYSVGQNLMDDGGTHDPRDGDIVWRGEAQRTPEQP